MRFWVLFSTTTTTIKIQVLTLVKLEGGKQNKTWIHFLLKSSLRACVCVKRGGDGGGVGGSGCFEGGRI